MLRALNLSYFHIARTHPLVGVDVPFGGFYLLLHLSTKIALFVLILPISCKLPGLFLVSMVTN